MPKKASSKNREWEKDRRDRLNVALENLSKALPLHDASVALSKFDIVQRAIRVVQDQEDKVRALLSKDHSMILKTQEQLEDGFKVMLVRNAELVALLKKHKIKVPPFTPPSILSCVVFNKDGDKVAENSNCTAIHGTQKQQQNSKLTVTEDSKTIKTKPTPLTSNKTNTQIATITPLLNGSLIPVRIIKRYRMICPALRDSGKVAIPRLRPSPGRNKKTALLQKLRHKVIKRSGRVSKTQNVQTSNEEIKENCDEAQKKNAIKRANGEILESSTTTIKQPKLNDDSVLKICSNHMEAETEKTVPSEILTSLEPQSKETQPSPPNRCDESQTLSIDILNGLPDTALVENCPDTLSPTAAFLMSFPVVSAAEKRIENHEPTEDEPCSAQELLQCEVKQADHINILENISSLLTTRDFERFVSDDSMASKSVAANLKEMEGNPERSEKREIVAEVQTCKEYPEVKICEFVKPQPKQLSYYSSSRKEPQCSVSNEKPSFSFSLTTASSSFLSESGFYDSLSNIGSSSAHHRTDPTFVSSPYISNPIMPNLYIHPESTTSMNFCPKPDTPQTPFTFSLTSTTQTLPSSKHSSSLVGTISTSVKPITTLAVSKLTNPTSHYHHTPSIPAPTTIFSQTSSYNDHLATNNNYNPFAFDNIPAGPPIKSDSSQFTFSLTSTTNSTPINTPSFSAHPRPQVSITNPFSIDHNILSDQRPSKSSSHNLQAPLIPPHSSSSSSSSSSTTTTTQCYPPKTTSTFAIPTTYHQPHQPKASPQKSTQKSQHKSHVNWMTSTDDFNPTSTDSLPVTFQTPKHPDISYMHSHEDAFSWSPNKLILDSTTHASLPNLHGDLALNNYVARPHLSSIPSTKRTKKPEPVPMPSNFSVCQLVDQRKSVNSFRSSEKHKEFEAGDQKTRAKTTQSSSKEKHRSFNYSSNIFVDSFTNPSPITTKPTISSNSNNYSTESLLSSQCSSNTTTMLHQHHRDKFLGSYHPTTADFHHPPPDPSAVPPMDFVSDPFYPNNYLPQKLHCPSDNVYPEPEYTNTPHYPIRTRTSNQQTSSFPQTHTAHVYPFSSSSSSGGRTADAQKPQNFHSTNYFATSTHSTTTTTEPSSSSSVIHHHHPPPHPHQQHQSHHHPQHYAHHQHFPPYHDPTTSTARSNQQPFSGGRHHLQSQQVSAPAASSSSFHPGGSAPSYGAPSHLVSDFNLSTICPEINNDKGVVATAVGQQNW